MGKKTAVLFKCHNWDAVIQRSYERCKKNLTNQIFIYFTTIQGEQ